MFVIKEGVSYRIRIDFIVQREIVHGLKYVQKTYRMGMPGKMIVPETSVNSSVYAELTVLFGMPQILCDGSERYAFHVQ